MGVGLSPELFLEVYLILPAQLSHLQIHAVARDNTHYSTSLTSRSKDTFETSSRVLTTGSVFISGVR